MAAEGRSGWIWFGLVIALLASVLLLFVGTYGVIDTNQGYGHPWFVIPCVLFATVVISILHRGWCEGSRWLKSHSRRSSGG